MLSLAATRADESAIRDRLARGEPVEGLDGINTPLWCVCASEAPAEQRIACAQLLLEAGASPRSTGEGATTPLHQAARRGPLALVELLIRHGALVWQPDQQGRTALEHARAGSAADRARIVQLLDRPVIRDPHFRMAVELIQSGDVKTLSSMLDAYPALLRQRAIEPDCYPHDYFRDPKLFWFIANNPMLMRKMPANIVEIGRVMLDRGIEQADLDYTLELVMSNGQSGKEGRQADLMTLLMDAGATTTPQAILVALAHGGCEAIQKLIERGSALTVPMAAGLGRDAELASRLLIAPPDDRQAALGVAVINRRIKATRLCLVAGADPNGLLPVHRHSTPLHQAAANDDVEMLELLIAHGANPAIRDTLWRGTPLDWAVHTKKAKAEAYLRALAQGVEI